MTFLPFSPLKKAIFLKRINRFIAEVNIDGIIEKVHVPSTGRLDGVLEAGAICYLKASRNPNRKTAYSLFLIEKENKKICVDSLIANEFAYQILKNKDVEGINNGKIKREVAIDSDRLDFVVVGQEKSHYIEVKSVNKAENGVACFPDAPTERGRKHLLSLIKHQQEPFIQSHIIFVVQRNDAASFSPCIDRDPEFAKLLKTAFEEGVKIHVCLTTVKEDGIYFDKWLPFELL